MARSSHRVIQRKFKLNVFLFMKSLVRPLRGTTNRRKTNHKFRNACEQCHFVRKCVKYYNVYEEFSPIFAIYACLFLN